MSSIFLHAYYHLFVFLGALRILYMYMSRATDLPLSPSDCQAPRSVDQNTDWSPLPGFEALPPHLAGLDFSSLVCKVWTAVVPPCQGWGRTERVSSCQAPRTLRLGEPGQ